MRAESTTYTRTVAIVQARMGSTRLPGKVLMELAGRPLLSWFMERIEQAETLDSIVIATSGAPADDAIVEFCQANGVECFRGSERDVLDRYYRAAQAFEACVIVRLTSDCPLIDPVVVDQVVQTFSEANGQYDYVANTAPPPGSFPDGMDVEVFSFEALERAWQEARALDAREHVTFEFWRNPERYRTHRVEAPEDWSDVRLTVDDAGDLELVDGLLQRFGSELPPLADLVCLLREELGDASRGHSAGEGWKPPADTSAAAPALQLTKSDALWKRAAKVIPGGAQTFSKMPAQYVDGVAPKVLVRGIGARVWDADGNEYLDYLLGLGPALLGHAHGEVNQAAFHTAQDSFCSPSLPHPLEFQLAEKIIGLVPCAEMVRYGKNGSDATAGAVRVARGVTGRDVIACAGYHGWQDWYIGSTTRRCGVPEAVSKLTKPFTYGNIESLQRIFEESPGQVAGVILEPVCLVPPPPGYLEAVRALCTENGALLIFDEIITGFRLHMGGAQTLYGVTPDLATFGKAVANGWPLSVLCGKACYMQILEEAFYSFTFGGELPSIAAGFKTLEILEREQTLERVHQSGRLMREGIERAAQESGLHCLRAVGLDFFPGYAIRGVEQTPAILIQTLLQQELVRRGLLMRSCLFISTAHSHADLAFTIERFTEAASVVQEALQAGQVKEAIDGEIIQPVFRSTP